jgi:cellobiose phosphorylase
MKNADEAFEVYRRICPAYVEDISELHKTEPYVYSQMVAGQESAKIGEAKNSWLTGTAAWTFVNVSQYLLGIQPTLDGLVIDPCLPERFGQVTVQRRYRDALYNIRITRGAEPSLTVDGKKAEGCIPPAKAGTECNVEVVVK